MTVHKRRDIAILNRSTLISDIEVEAITNALRTQVLEHYYPAWGMGANISFVPKSDTTSWKGKWNLLFLDNLDIKDALGYHDLTPEGKPVGFIGVQEDQQYNEPVSRTASHELLEMLGDPYINLEAEDYDGKIYAYENCDPVQSDGYKIKGVPLSNFVYPEWFCPQTEGTGAKFDYLNELKHPFELASGGYISVKENGVWTQVWGQKGPSVQARPSRGSRRYRRVFVPRKEWVQSPA